MDDPRLKKRLSRLEYKRDRLLAKIAKTYEQISSIKCEMKYGNEFFDQGPGVYVIQCHDMYKIGRADNLRVRLSTLQISSPYELRVILFIPCCEKESNDLENNLHEKYVARWRRGEWYQLTSLDLAEIKHIQDWRANGHLLSQFNESTLIELAVLEDGDKDYKIQRRRTKQIVDIIRDVMREQNGPASRDVVIERFVETGGDQNIAEKILDKLRRDGDVFEPIPGMLKLP